MKHTASVVVDAAPDEVAAVVADLGTYPEWNDVVVDAVVDGPAAWVTTLRARVGPFARSKQLRMVRTADDTNGAGSHRIRFERVELPERQHAAWIMDATIRSSDGGGSLVELGLEYRGGLWTVALEGVLGAAIDRASNRLPDYVEQRGNKPGSAI